MALRWSDYIASGFGQSKTPGTRTPDNNSQTYKSMPLHTDRNKINHACISASNVRPIEDENSVKPAFKSALRQRSLTPRHMPKRNEFISRHERSYAAAKPSPAFRHSVIHESQQYDDKQRSHEQRHAMDFLCYD